LRANARRREAAPPLPAAAVPSPSRPLPRGAVAAIAASFRFAWDGVVETALHQRNMRIHLVAALLVALLASAVPLGAAADLALLFCVFLVVSAEVANSALEALVDLVTRERHDRARAAKDAGAGAVLVLAAGSVAVFAAVVVHAWPRLAAAQAALARQAIVGLPLALAAALLLAPFPRPRAADRVLAVAGLAPLAALAAFTANAVFTALAAALFAVSAAAARRRRSWAPASLESP
jgi:diacylglycerol kinase (ATP)